jgi:SnoaL-like domain
MPSFLSLGKRLLAVALVSLAGTAAQAADSIDALAQDVERIESLRQVKDLQRTYVQLSQAGLWNEMGALFTRDAKFIRGSQSITGSDAIAKWLTQQGGGRQGLAPGALRYELIDQPLGNLAADGRSAKVRWMAALLAGDGKDGTTIEGGIYENEYVRDGNTWKISLSRYYPQYDGNHANGWRNTNNADLPIIPYHFTLAESGIPLPPAASPAPRSKLSLAALESRIAALNDEDAVRNLQHAYGYYVDRRMWDDVVDLFAKDGIVEIAGVGTFTGPEGVRRAMDRMGPAGLSQGVLNDHPLFDTIVKVRPGGTEAISRGLELGQIGDANKGTQHWEFNVFRNRFVKEGGIWKVREMRIFPVVHAEYSAGWGKGGKTPPANRAIPAFAGAHPVTGKAVNAVGYDLFARAPLTGAIAAGKAATPKGSAAERLAAARRGYARSAAWDGSENVSSAYSYYIDDFQWPEMAGLFAEKGNKHSPFAGYYIGPERIIGAVNANYGSTQGATRTRAGIAYHWRIQPVIIAAEDGRSTTSRVRLIQTATGKQVEGRPNNSAFSSGMYPHDQSVLENGVWKLWALEIDEHYMTSDGWKGGWSGVKPVGADRPPSRPSQLLTKYPPDILMSAIGRRAEGFRGGTGQTIEWPGILPMWFHYRNPVSGREPSHFQPDCVPCELRPESRMTNHGYLLPPAGP